MPCGRCKSSRDARHCVSEVNGHFADGAKRRVRGFRRLQYEIDLDFTMDWNSLSNTVIVAEIGKRLREYRLKKRLTQQELADRAGISLFTVVKIEAGKPVSIGMLIPVMRVLRLLDNLELLLPEIGVSPIEMLKLKGKTPKRIRSKKAQE